MLILGIETSCDETSAAVVEETGDAAKPWAIRSNVIAAQVPTHREWGGVVPELASRQHSRDICGVVDRALDEAGARWADLGAVAVTQGPGLVGSLLVGVSFAKAAAAATGLPLVAVHHLAGHIESLILQNGELPLPAIVLVVSGGHTSLYLVDRPGRYQPLRRTRDDAARRQEHRRLGRRVGEQQAAGRFAASRSAARDADVRAEPGALNGQRRDDRGGWSTETPGGRARAGGSQRGRRARFVNVCIAASG